MRSLFSIAVLLLAFTLSAQKDVTKFLGIPVDGTKAEMLQKLKAKGFTSNEYNKDILEGEFNGHQVNIHIVTNNNKVYRIMVCDAKISNETNIKIRFNNLCNQFSNNSRYTTFYDNIIPEEEDISYNMLVNNKRYEAIYYQNLDSTTMNKLYDLIKENYNAEQLANPTKKIKDEIFEMILPYIEKKPVWFIISDHYGQYYITMYYDNEYNRANGQDL